jgi:hypothetical protein
MRKRILPLMILCFFICVGQVGAAVCPAFHYYYAPNDLETVTGTFQAMGRNSIDIMDELQKRVVRLIYFDQGEEFHKGDYLRVYYHPQDAVVVKIKRMTVLDYKENGQNLGNVFRQSSN